MIYLYFEDATQFLFLLDYKQIAHGDRIIKVFPSPFDPRIRLNDPNLKVIEEDDSPLFDLTFRYKDRGTYTGVQIEEEMTLFHGFARRGLRALFRFSNRENLRFCQTGMRIKRKGEWLIDHPFKEMDIPEIDPQLVMFPSEQIHLDIFNRWSLKRLAKDVDISPGSREMIDWRSAHQLRKEIAAERSGMGLERRQ